MQNNANNTLKNRKGGVKMPKQQKTTQVDFVSKSISLPLRLFHPHFPRLWQAFTCAGFEQKHHCAICSKQCMLFCLGGQKKKSTHIGSLCSSPLSATVDSCFCLQGQQDRLEWINTPSLKHQVQQKPLFLLGSSWLPVASLILQSTLELSGFIVKTKLCFFFYFFCVQNSKKDCVWEWIFSHKVKYGMAAEAVPVRNLSPAATESWKGLQRHVTLSYIFRLHKW